MFYAVVGAVTAVFSLIGVNLGGFFLGLILGIVGAGLVFGWTPLVAAPPVAATPPGDALIPAQPGPVDAEPAVDETAEQPVGFGQPHSWPVRSRRAAAVARAGWVGARWVRALGRGGWAIAPRVQGARPGRLGRCATGPGGPRRWMGRPPMHR